MWKNSEMSHFCIFTNGIKVDTGFQAALRLCLKCLTHSHKDRSLSNVSYISLNYPVNTELEAANLKPTSALWQRSLFLTLILLMGVGVATRKSQHRQQRQSVFATSPPVVFLSSPQWTSMEPVRQKRKEEISKALTFIQWVVFFDLIFLYEGNLMESETYPALNDSYPW